MNALVLCALLVGADPEPEIEPTFGPKLTWTIPTVGTGKEDPAQVVAISADGSLVAAGFRGPQYEPNQLAVYDRKTRAEIYRADADKSHPSISSLRFSRDNRYLAVSLYCSPGDFQETVRATHLIDLKEKNRVKKWEEGALVFSPTADVAYLITQAHIEVLELPGLKTARKIEVAHARGLAVSPDGKTLAALTRTPLNRPTGGYRDEVVVFDDAGAVRIRYETEAMSLAFSPDGKRLATGHWRGEARVWSVVKEDKPLRLKVERPYGLFPLWFGNDTLGLFLPDREWGSTDPAQLPTWTDMYLCDLSRGEPEAVRWRFENAPNRTFVTGRYALSADRQLLVAASNGLSVIDLKARKVERTFPGWKELGPKK